ncbi:hypothetical protein [Exiguobacterium acetylicum]|uniref:hypothetical protein n=1 Tax=Exiguobacterium acetylicum TaxID=41170 RepID=UPI00068D4969|nr:hypothetical protein [Exiguobacterium acetylicum]
MKEIKLTSSVRLIGALGLLLFLLSQAQQMLLYLIILLSLGVLSSIINIRFITFIQSQCAEQTMGRVMSVVNAASNGLVPLSYALLSFFTVVSRFDHDDHVVQWSSYPCFLTLFQKTYYSSRRLVKKDSGLKFHCPHSAFDYYETRST